jgi:hypothetical protein
MRLDGHHLSLNWTALPDAPLSVTPLFLGGQPRRVPEPLDRAGLRVLADEEDRAVELVQALSEPQRAVARLPFDDGSELSRPMFVGDGPEWSPAAAAGIPRSSLDEAVRARLDALVEVYLANFTAAVAERQRARIAAQSDAIHFAYAVPDTSLGRPLTAGDRLYYRVQGRGFLIEYDNTAEAADHVHVVWREAVGDFGRDLLAEHLAAHHGAGRSH